LRHQYTAPGFRQVVDAAILALIPAAHHFGRPVS